MKKPKSTDAGPFVPVGTKVKLLRPHLFSGKEGVVLKSTGEFHLIGIGAPGQAKWSTAAQSSELEVLDD